MSPGYRIPADRPEEFVSYYEANGFFAVDPLFAPEEVEACRRRISAIIHRETPEAEGIYVQVEPSVVHGEATAESHELSVRKIAEFVGRDPVLTDLAGHPRLVEAITAILGPDVKLLQDMALLKPPFFGSRKTWHQDCPYFPIEPPDVLGCWIALDPATPENGCMHVAPGSHKLGAIPHRTLRVEGESFDDFGIPTEDAGSLRSLPVPLSPGGVLFFHGLTAHSTPPNRTPDRRRAIQLHYMDARCRFTGKPDRKPAYRLIAGREHPGAV